MPVCDIIFIYFLKDIWIMEKEIFRKEFIVLLKNMEKKVQSDVLNTELKKNKNKT